MSITRIGTVEVALIASKVVIRGWVGGTSLSRYAPITSTSVKAFDAERECEERNRKGNRRQRRGGGKIRTYS
jgi:hypothetical protein